MKKLTLIMATALMSSMSFATELPALKQADVATVSVGIIEIDGVRYEKVIPTNQVQSNQSGLKTFGANVNAVATSQLPGLYQGDLLKRNKLSSIERISGNLYISSTDINALKDIAKAHDLDISYSQGNVAILKAPQGKELMSLLNALKSDKRIKVANLERVANKMRPE